MLAQGAYGMPPTQQQLRDLHSKLLIYTAILGRQKLEELRPPTPSVQRPSFVEAFKFWLRLTVNKDSAITTNAVIGKTNYRARTDLHFRST